MGRGGGNFGYHRMAGVHLTIGPQGDGFSNNSNKNNNNSVLVILFSLCFVSNIIVLNPV